MLNHSYIKQINEQGKLAGEGRIDPVISHVLPLPEGADAIIVQAMPGDAISVLRGMNQIGYKAQILGHLGFGETGTLGGAKELSE